MANMNDTVSTVQAGGVAGATIFGIALPDLLLIISLFYTSVMLVLKLPELYALAKKGWTSLTNKETDNVDE